MVVNDKLSYYGWIFMTQCHRVIKVSRNNLKELRKSRNMTQLALQMKTGVEQALISKFENGERIPPTETLIVLADFYNVSIGYILGRTDKPEINK